MALVNMPRFAAILLSALIVAGLEAAPLAVAQEQGVVALVNDQPVTQFDISQRIALLKILRDARPEGLTRKQALKSLVDEQVKIAEVKKFGFTPSDAEITKQIERFSKSMNTTPGGLTDQLKKAGVSDLAFRRYIGTQIGFNRIIAAKYRENVKITDADIDRKMADIKTKADSRMSEIMRDPRMRAVTVYQLMEINLPVEDSDPALLQARAIEAAQLVQRFKGCGNAKAAAAGIFNVKIGKKVEADGAKLPPPMKAALDKAGVGRAIGPMRSKVGIQLIALCGVRKLTPPKPKFAMPTREQVQNALINEKYDGFEEEYLKTARQSIYVEYRDASLSQ